MSAVRVTTQVEVKARTVYYDLATEEFVCVACGAVERHVLDPPKRRPCRSAHRPVPTFQEVAKRWRSAHAMHALREGKP